MNTLDSLARVAIAASCVAGLVPVWAQAPPDDDAPASPLFETATVYARPVEQATARITVLDREAIESHQATSVAELIRLIPGVHLSGGGPRGAVASAQIRGGDPNFTVVLLDGVPLNDATDTFGGAVNLSSLPTDHLERIEVVHGPLSSYFGSPGLAGAIHLITRRGTAGEPRVDAAVGAGNAETLSGRLSLAGGSARHDYFVGASWAEESGRVADSDFDQLDVRFGLGFEASDDSVRLTGRAADWSATDYPEGSGGPVLGDGQTRDSDHDELSLGVTWEPGNRRGSRTSHRLRGTLYRHTLTRTSPAIGFLVPPSTEDTEYTTLALAWSMPVIAARRTRLSVGVELERERGENRGQLLVPPAFGGPIDASYTIRRDAGAAYLEWIVERGTVVFELGARLDVPEGFDHELSPRAGLAWRPGNGPTRLSVNVGRGFKLPSFFALASPSALGGNPLLEPEASLGGDARVERRWGDTGLTTSVTAFYNRFRDLIDFDFQSFMNVNRSEVTSRGLELAVDWLPHPDVEVHVAWTTQDIEDRQSGQPLRHRPDHAGSARLIFRATEKVRGQVDATLVSEFPDEQIPVPTRTAVPGSTLYGGAVHVDLSPRFSLGLRVDNATDHRHENFIGFPGPGRSYRVTLRRSLR